MPIFDILYLFFLVLSLPLWIRILFKKEYRLILKYRLIPSITPSQQQRIWIHAVSVGEVKSVKSLVEQLTKQYKREIVLSVTTPSGFAFARQEYRDMAVHIINAPLDFSFTIKKFLKAINPAVLLLNELETWPNWILKTKKANIPILLINGRISDNAFKRYKRFSFLFKGFMDKIDRFLVQADVYKEKFIALGIPESKITVCGNIKADTAAKAATELPENSEIFEYLKIPAILRQKAKLKKIITFASTHHIDEDVFLPILNNLRESFFLIIVPRHLERLEEIENRLQEQNIAFARWSRRGSGAVNLDKEVLLFDQMGYLFTILKISDIVFMGGTFDPKTGGHSLYEPAALGKMVVGGPYYNNFPDIGRELQDRGVYQTVRTTGELALFFENASKLDFGQVKQQATAVITRRCGSIDCILKEIRAMSLEN